MKVQAKIPRGSLQPTAAVVTIEARDAVFVAHLLSYARRAGMDSLDAGEKRKAERILHRLAAACEALDADANAYLEEHSRDYHETRRLFDELWKGDST